MKKILMTALLFLFSNAVKESTKTYRRASLDLAKIKLALTYVKGVHSLRLLFMGLFSIGLAWIFILVGLLVMEGAFFFFGPWLPETKFWLGLLCAVGYLIIAGLILVATFSHERWLEMFHAPEVLRSLDAGAKEHAEQYKKESDHRRETQRT